MGMSRILNSKSIGCTEIQPLLLNRPLRLLLPATVLLPPAGILPRLRLQLPARLAGVLLPVQAAGLLSCLVRQEHATALGLGVPAPNLAALRCGCSHPLQ
jgi:hypothetical protein